MLERVFHEPIFRVCCLGGFRLIDLRSGTDMSSISRKARALLAYLCITGKPSGRERLAALLWGDRGDEQARASLRQTIYELRTMPGAGRLLTIDRDTVGIGENVSTDIAAIADAAHSNDLEQLGQALSEWRGDLLEDLLSINPAFDTWRETERVAIQEKLIAAATEAVEAAIARGEAGPARKIVNLLQQRDGSNEMVIRLGLRLDHLCGDSAALHRRYERFRNVLESELDAAPSAETQRLFRELTSKASVVPPGFIPGPIEGVPNGSAGNAPVGAAEAVYASFNPGAETRVPEPSTGSARHALKGIAAGALALLAIVALGWGTWPKVHRPAPPQREPLLAVLPFENLSGDAGSRYFSDGITEEIVDALLRNTQIRVAAPSSSFRFRGSRAPQAAKALAATHILSGSVQRGGNRVHIVAQLTDVQGDRMVWSRTYDRTLAEVPALQHDIAARIASALDMRLSSASLAEMQRVNPVAYDHYLKGRDLFMRRDAVDSAESELEEAVRLAPNFANAWSTLAATRLIFTSYMLSDGEQGYASMENAARNAAQHALALDPKDGEALGVLAMLTPLGRLTEIDRLFERALRLEPNDTQLLNWYASFLYLAGRRSDALYEWTYAYELDRVTPSVALNLAEAYLDMDRFDDARKIVDLSPKDGVQAGSIVDLNVDYFLLKRDWPALAKYLATLPETVWPWDRRFLQLARETAVALAARKTSKLPSLRAQWRSARFPENMNDVVQFLFALGDSDGALAVFDRGVGFEKAGNMLAAPYWNELFVSNLAPLRHDPRVPALLAKWRLWDYWRTTNHWPDFCGEPGLPFDCRTEARKYASSTKLIVSRHAP